MNCRWCIPSKNYFCRWHNGSNGARQDPKPRMRKSQPKMVVHYPIKTLVAQSSSMMVDPSKQFRDGTPFPDKWNDLSGSMKRVLQHQHRGNNRTKSALSLEDVDAFVGSL